MLEGIQIYYNRWHDVVAWRWKKGVIGMAEVVRAHRRDYRQNPVRWTVGRLEAVDARKLDLKANGLKQASVEALRQDPQLPEAQELLRALEGRFRT